MLVIDDQGQNLGAMETTDALRLSRERGLDLVEIAPHLHPPVCRIVDFGRYVYQLEKKERERRAHQKQSEVKGIRITVRAAKHDLETRIKQLERFLSEGHKVRIEMILRGREKALQNFARGRMEEFLALIPDAFSWRIEQEIMREPNGLSLIIVSETKVQKKTSSATHDDEAKNQQIGSETV